MDKGEREDWFSSDFIVHLTVISVVALAYGGIASLLIMPLVGRLTTVIDNRILTGVGLVINALAVYLMSLYNLRPLQWENKATKQGSFLPCPVVSSGPPPF